jgi:hypothetical protein
MFRALLISVVLLPSSGCYIADMVLDPMGAATAGAQRHFPFYASDLVNPRPPQPVFPPSTAPPPMIIGTIPDAPPAQK